MVGRSEARITPQQSELATAQRPEIARRFYYPDIPRLLRQSGLDQDLIHPIAELRRDCHVLHTLQKAFLRLSDAERIAVFAETLPRLLPHSHADLWRQQVGDTDYTLPDDEYFADIPPAALARVKMTLENYEKRRQELWPFLLFDLDRTPLPDQAYPNEVYAATAKSIHSKYLALTSELCLDHPNDPSSAVQNQRIVRWQDRALAQQVQVAHGLVTRERSSSTASENIQAACQPIVDQVDTWLRFFMQFSREELAALLQEKIGSTNPDNQKVQYILQHRLAETREDICYLLLPRELREVLLRLYGVMRLVKPSTSGESGYGVAQDLYSIQGTLRALTPSGR